MPDSFDPDAWPGGSTPPNHPNNGKSNSEPNPYTGGAHSDDDDFDAFGFNDDPAMADDQDDDFGSFSYDFDEDQEAANPWGQQSQPSPVATSQRSARGGNDDFYGDDDDDDPYSNLYTENDDRNRNNYDDDDDFDRFDNFDDREPEQNNNLKRLLIGVGAGAFLLIALIVGISQALGGGDKEVAVTDNTGTTAAPAVSQEPAAPTETTAAPAAAAAADQPPAELARTLGDALRGWGQFAVNGDLDTVSNFFVPTSSQYLHFKDVESPALKAKPIGNPPYTMTLSNDTKAIKAGNDWKISGTVTAARPGEQDQQFRWEFTMTKVTPNSPWQISQVRQY